jgi:hypothetical protein
MLGRRLVLVGASTRRRLEGESRPTTAGVVVEGAVAVEVVAVVPAVARSLALLLVFMMLPPSRALPDEGSCGVGKFERMPSKCAVCRGSPLSR